RFPALPGLRVPFSHGGFSFFGRKWSELHRPDLRNRHFLFQLRRGQPRATEWVFFFVELPAAFIFLYYWGRLSEKKHLAIGWIYAVAAWISLVLITGITAFMLNPGRWAIDPAARNFWTAFFNPQFVPQTVVRTGGALLLSSLYESAHK
ncbi:MAG: cytochrome ubiquinol oxidase subunit I, partial [Planctomycetales bacterium]|nr:cytochrome ubiquinol oxidase subunit I [Planctomycetales bacterium]